MAGQPSSPLATGGAGVIFEYQVAAILMSRLVRGAAVPLGVHGPLARVAYQQASEGYPLDDLVAWAEADPPARAPSVQVQVKRRVSVTAGDPEFGKVMSAAVQACEGQPERVRERGLLFGMAVRRSGAGHLDELTELTDLARAHDRPETFGNRFREGEIRKSLRKRLDEVTAAIAATAVGYGTAEPAQLTHQVLRALHVWQVEEGPDGREWRAELDGLKELSDAAGKSPSDIMSQLLAMATRLGPRAGNVDAEHVRQELARFEIYLPAGKIRARRPEYQATIHAHDQSTVISGQHQNFSLNFYNRPSASGQENETP